MKLNVGITFNGDTVIIYDVQSMERTCMKLVTGVGIAEELLMVRFINDRGLIETHVWRAADIKKIAPYFVEE